MLYKDWINSCLNSEMQSDFLEYVVEVRNNGVMDENLHRTYLKAGMIGVPDPQGETFWEHLDGIGKGYNLDDVYLNEDELYKLGGAFIVPVWSSSFEPLFFINYSDTRDKSMKYINVLPEKRKPAISGMRIYGLENTALALEKGVMFVCEGVFDKLRLESQGLPVCTTLGSEIGDYHRRILSRFDKLVYIGDNDAAGAKGKRKFFELLPKTNMVNVPREKDIDDFGALHKKDFDLFISELKDRYM